MFADHPSPSRRVFIGRSLALSTTLVTPTLAQAEPITVGTVTLAFLKALYKFATGSWTSKGAVTAMTGHLIREIGSASVDAVAEDALNRLLAKSPRPVESVTTHDDALKELWTALGAMHAGKAIDHRALWVHRESQHIDWEVFESKTVQVLEAVPIEAGKVLGQFGRQYQLELALRHPLEQTFEDWKGTAVMLRDANGWKLSRLKQTNA